MNTRGLEIDNFCHNTFWTKFGEEVHANVLMLKLIKFSAPFFLSIFIFHAYLIDSLYAVTKYLNVNAWNTNKYWVEFWCWCFTLKYRNTQKLFYRKATAYLKHPQVMYIHVCLNHKPLGNGGATMAGVKLNIEKRIILLLKIKRSYIIWYYVYASFFTYCWFWFL